MKPNLSRPRVPRFAGDPRREEREIDNTAADYSPSTPPKSRRKVLSPANWVAGAVRQLKKGEKTDSYAEVDAAFNLVARLDGVDQAQVSLTTSGGASCTARCRVRRVWEFDAKIIGTQLGLTECSDDPYGHIGTWA